MFIAELIKRNRNIKQRIDELEFYLEKIADIPNVKESGPVYTNVLNRIFGLLDTYQSHMIALERSNISTEIEVGTAKLSVSDAIKLRATTEEKIRFFTSLIDNNDASLNVPDLMDKRDKLVEERLLLDNAIGKSDWSTEID